MYMPETQMIPQTEYTLMGSPVQSLIIPLVGLPRRIQASAPTKVLVKKGRMAESSTQRFPRMSVFTTSQARGEPMIVARKTTPKPTSRVLPTVRQ